nr:NAD(P)-dependent oxidoreductase [uncultured Pseudodesulfovibrio sp.]
MRVLVTGGAGYIGCLAVEELLKAGHEPVVFDTLNWGGEGLDENKDKIEMIEGDVRSSKDLVYALEGVDAVVHLAGIVGEPACKNNYKAHFTINIESTKTLLDCMTDPNIGMVKDFIFLSSCSVYGNVKGLYDEVTEMTPTSPLSLYADAKLQAENIINDYAARFPHFHPTILRLTTVFGWSPRPRLDLVTNLFAYRAWKEGKITIFGDGMQYRSLIHVHDVAKAVVHTLDTPRFLRDRKIYHLGEEANNRTVRDIAMIVKGYMPETEVEFLEGEPTDKRDYKINCQRIKNILGWKAQYTVEDGIKQMLEKLEENDWDWESFKYRNNKFDYV